MSPYREDPPEVTRRKELEKAAQRAPEINKKEGRSEKLAFARNNKRLMKVKAIRDRVPLTPVDVLHMDAIEQDKEREKHQRLFERRKPKTEFDRVKEELMEKDKQRLEAFFGVPIDVPPLPEGITLEHILFWKENRFELQFWPRIDMTEDKNFPGWKHKPGKKYAGSGIDFFAEVGNMVDLSENKKQPQARRLEPTELPGAWVLRDVRPKPNYDEGRQEYEDDHLIRNTLRRLWGEGLLNQEAVSGRRNKIHPDVFVEPKFWETIKKALKADQIPGAIARLPRVIESSVMGQDPEFHKTNTYEWCEEVLRSGERLICGGSEAGGVSCVGWCIGADGCVGFRPLIVFPTK